MDDRFLAPPTEEAGDAHTARQGQDHTLDLCLHEEEDEASLILQALLDEAVATLMRAARDPRPPEMARAELAVLHTRLVAAHAPHRDKCVAEKTLMLRVHDHHYLLLEMHEAARTIHRVDPLPLQENGRDHSPVALPPVVDRAETPVQAPIDATAHP